MGLEAKSQLKKKLKESEIIAFMHQKSSYVLHPVE